MLNATCSESSSAAIAAVAATLLTPSPRMRACSSRTVSGAATAYPTRNPASAYIVENVRVTMSRASSVPAVDENLTVGQRDHAVAEHVPRERNGAREGSRQRIPDHRSEISFGRNVARSSDDQHFPVVHERHVYGIDGHKSGYCVPREPVKWIGERGAKRTPRCARLLRKEKRRGHRRQREAPGQRPRKPETLALRDQMAPPGGRGSEGAVPRSNCQCQTGPTAPWRLTKSQRGLR